MSYLFDQGVDAVRSLPEERQDAAGELLLSIAAPDADESYSLTASQVADVRAAVRDADRGELATSDELNELWRYCSL